MVENKKKKNQKNKNRSDSRPMEISNIVRFFAIILIIFGLTFIGQGSYAIYKDSKGKNTSNMPVVSISRVNDIAIVKVNGINKIANFKYSWNSAEETNIPVEDTFVEEEIMLPIENSVLNVTIEEETGRKIKYRKEFIIEGLDITQPTIKIAEENSNGNIKITATDETAISYITYKINDDEAVRINKSELEDKEINYILKLPKGENTVIITAVDSSGNTEILEKKIIVSGKTDIGLNIENGKLIITAKDPDGIKDIEINLNGLVYTAKNINQKGVRLPLNLVEGVNTIKITVTNVNSLVSVVVKEFNYVQ